MNGGAPCLCGPDEKHRRPLLVKAAGARNATRVNDMLACVTVLAVARRFLHIFEMLGTLDASAVHS